MNMLKYILIHIEFFVMLFSFILGIGAAENNSWGIAFILLFTPFVWGWASNFIKQIHFCEVYQRACIIKNHK